MGEHVGTGMSYAGNYEVDNGQEAVWNLGSMLSNTNKCGIFSNLRLLNYGSWCGYGGRGQPVDEVDRCCKLHDMCYDKYYRDGAGICWFGVYVPYDWKKVGRTVKCLDPFNTCARSYCECDKDFAI